MAINGGAMHRSGTALICAVLLAGPLLVSCNQPLAPPSVAESSAAPDSAIPRETAAPSVADVDLALQQRVKNICMDQLQAQATGATPAPGQLRPPKVTLVKVGFLGETKQITLPESATGYELGIEFVYKVGNNDSKTGRKYCRTNLEDSTVDWRWTASP